MLIHIYLFVENSIKNIDFFLFNCPRHKHALISLLVDNEYQPNDNIVSSNLIEEIVKELLT